MSLSFAPKKVLGKCCRGRVESEAEFNAGITIFKVDYWACSVEEHQNDDFHYHCALKLTGCKKWLSVKNKSQVNFSDKHNFYHSVYRYVCKSDQEVAHSENHLPGLLTTASPKTKKSITGFRSACHIKRQSTEGESSCAVQRSEKV